MVPALPLQRTAFAAHRLARDPRDLGDAGRGDRQPVDRQVEGVHPCLGCSLHRADLDLADQRKDHHLLEVAAEGPADVAQVFDEELDETVLLERVVCGERRAHLRRPLRAPSKLRAVLHSTTPATGWREGSRRRPEGNFNLGRHATRLRRRTARTRDPDRCDMDHAPCATSSPRRTIRLHRSVRMRFARHLGQARPASGLHGRPAGSPPQGGVSGWSSGSVMCRCRCRRSRGARQLSGRYGVPGRPAGRRPPAEGLATAAIPARSAPANKDPGAIPGWLFRPPIRRTTPTRTQISLRQPASQPPCRSGTALHDLP